MKPSDYYGSTFERSSDWVERAAEPGFAPVGVVIAAAAPFLAKGGRVLDIGCQGGHQLSLVMSMFDEAHGVDIAAYDEMWARFPEAKFLVHDVDEGSLPFPAGHFDSIIATNVLEHVFDVFGFIHEAHRLLRPGGTLLISVPNVGEVRRVWTLLRGRVPRTGTLEYPFSEAQGWDGQHLHYFTPKELRILVESCGFRCAQVLTVGKYPQLKRLWPTGMSSSIDLILVRE